MDDAVRLAVAGPVGSLLPAADQGPFPVSRAVSGWLSAVVRHGSAERIDLFSPKQGFQLGEQIWRQLGIDTTGKTVTIRPLANLGRVLAQRSVQALHVPWGLPWAGTIATALGQTPWPFVRVTANVYGIPQSLDLVGSACYLQALGPGDGIVAASPAVSDWLQAVGCGTSGRPAIKVLGPAVDTERLLPGDRAAARGLLGLAQNAFVLVSGECFQPVSPSMLFPLLLACRELAAQGADVRLVQVVPRAAGDGSLRALVRSLGLEQRVSFVSAQGRANTTLALYYQAADVCVPSLPMPGEMPDPLVLEACACGCALAGIGASLREQLPAGLPGTTLPEYAAVPGLAEGSDDGWVDPGYVRELADRVTVDAAALRGELEGLWRHPEQRAARGADARRYAVDALGWRHHIAAYEEWWSDLASRDLPLRRTPSPRMQHPSLRALGSMALTGQDVVRARQAPGTLTELWRAAPLGEDRDGRGLRQVQRLWDTIGAHPQGITVDELWSLAGSEVPVTRVLVWLLRAGRMAIVGRAEAAGSVPPRTADGAWGER